MDILFFLIAVALGLGLSGGSDSLDSTELAMPGVQTPEIPHDPEPAFEAEDQTPTGKFTTATEVRPILTATKPGWVAVREWDGQDLLYFTNLLAWRCGVFQISYAVNGGPEQVLDAEPCYLDQATPNAIQSTDILPFVTLPLGEVQALNVRVIFDDLTEEIADYDRASIQIN